MQYLAKTPDSLAAVFSVVKQRSPQTAAHIRTYLSLRCLCASEITKIVSDVTNQSKGECNQHCFTRELASALQWRKYRKRFYKSIFAIFAPLQLTKRKKSTYLGKVLSICQRFLDLLLMLL